MKPTKNATILHSPALREPGAKTVPTTISPTSLASKFVFSITAYINTSTVHFLEKLSKQQIISWIAHLIHTQKKNINI